MSAAQLRRSLAVWRKRGQRARKMIARRKAQLRDALATPTKTSRRGLDLIASFEGWVDHAYLDPVGIWTIGFGHVIRRGERFPVRITRERGLQLLAQDVGVAEAAVRRLVKVRLTQAQFDALVAFAFNVGTGALADSTLLRELNAEHYRAAADQFLRWTHAGGRELPGLVRRRRAERALFLS